jgi:hypothetical protein
MLCGFSRNIFDSGTPQKIFCGVLSFCGVEDFCGIEGFCGVEDFCGVSEQFFLL